MSDWWDTAPAGPLEVYLRRLAVRNWGEYPPTWVIGLEDGDTPPLAMRYHELAYVPRGRRGLMWLLRVCLPVVRRSHDWARACAPEVSGSLRLDDWDLYESGELPVPWAVLCMYTVPLVPGEERGLTAGPRSRSVLELLDEQGEASDWHVVDDTDWDWVVITPDW